MSSAQASEYGYSMGLLNIHNRNLMPLNYPRTFDELLSAIASRPLRFCFVRNPFTRLLSAYIDKIESSVNARRELFFKELLVSDDLQQTLSFRSFLNLLKRQNISSMNPHWRVQYYQSMFGLINFTHTGAFERFNEDLSRILSAINPILLQYISRVDEHHTKAAELLESYYSAPETVEIVREIYREDFDTFGYSRELEDATDIPTLSLS
ncbi:sulfotransferase family 2 domain-containing protein [Nostoc sphaeroides]|uniref:Sulfotransferase family protein n=1 Tax=Nostoc sphaeroides CCNUC1 TaxID=2653204 RepID=A0A5P8VY42_9NOSO|nr:sulfotransferase family 2 domain-containing protein [Nostoc sphaeroides]QFS45342.1 hypothetical protein GXM_02819 [Nostoc sphaeroides CCNUC1]